MTAEECEAEYARLKERERKGEEQLPAGAKKANKHYKPWEEEMSSRLSDAHGEISRDVSTTLDMTIGGGALDMTKMGCLLDMTKGGGAPKILKDRIHIK
jgi:hypothetical protein